MSPWEGHQKISQTGHNYTYNNPASLSKDTCESANPRVILRRRFNPRQVSFFMFKANGQAPVRAVQCLPN